MQGLRLSRSFILRASVAIAAGSLSATAFLPIDFGWISLFVLIPLFWAWRDQKILTASLIGFFYGVGFLLVLMFGLHYLGFLAYLSLAFLAALYYAAIGAVVAAFAQRGMRNPWLTAAIWIMSEGLRVRWPLGGLAWGELGGALHGFAAPRSLAGWGGVALISFLVVAINGFLYDFYLGLSNNKKRIRALSGLISILLLVAVGYVARFEPTPTGRIRFALIQGFDKADAELASSAIGPDETQAHFDLAKGLEKNFDLIVLPESALYDDPQVNPELKAQIISLAEKHNAVVLVNTRHYRANGKLYNTNFAYDPRGEVIGKYSKSHLVPFGEYVPWRSALSFIGPLRQIPYDFSPGTRRQTFLVDGHEVAGLICYESAYPGLVGDFVRDGAEAIVVSTSDRSYRRSNMAEAHFAQAQMRAAENARPVLQASISGVTGVIDSTGSVKARSELFENTVLTGSINTYTGDTPYVRWGDWLLLGAGLGLIGAALLVVRSGRRDKIQSST